MIKQMPKKSKRQKDYSITQLKDILRKNKVEFNNEPISERKRMDNMKVFKNYLYVMCLKHELIEKPFPTFP